MAKCNQVTSLPFKVLKSQSNTLLTALGGAISVMLQTQFCDGIPLSCFKTALSIQHAACNITPFHLVQVVFQHLQIQPNSGHILKFCRKSRPVPRSPAGRLVNPAWATDQRTQRADCVRLMLDFSIDLYCNYKHCFSCYLLFRYQLKTLT